MPRLSRYHEAVKRAVTRENDMQERQKGSHVVPMGMEMVENRTWRARWERANPQGKKAMREAMASKDDPMGVMATMKILGRAEQRRAPLEPARTQGEEEPYA